MNTRHLQAKFLSYISDMVNCSDDSRVMDECLRMGDYFSPVAIHDGAGGALVALHEDFDILLCAHTDRHPAGIGYDDGVGVAIALTALSELPEGTRVAAAFTLGEEDGGWGIQQMLTDGLHIPRAALVLDRCTSWEVVASIHGKPLCPLVVTHAVRTVMSDASAHWYEIVRGAPCDALHLADVTPTVNLSTGVYNQHTADEGFNFAAAWGTLRGVLALCREPERWLP